MPDHVLTLMPSDPLQEFREVLPDPGLSNLYPYDCNHLAEDHGYR